MTRRRKSNRFNFENLEERRCLTVSAAVADNGALRVFGDADGDVSIVALSENTFEVTDDGASIGVFENADKIRILLDREGNADNQVNIQLNDETVDGIFAAMGNGNNVLNVQGSESVGRVDFFGGQDNDSVRIDVATDRIISAVMRDGDDSLAVGENGHRLRFRGGHGNDTLHLNSETDVNYVGAIMGNGENTVGINGDVARALYIRGGDDADTVRIGEGSSIENLAANLGHGDNDFVLAGQIDNNLVVRTGAGQDTIGLRATASVGNRTSIVAGHGDNSIGLNSTHERGVFISAFSGNDEVLIGADANVTGRVVTLLGNGENQFTHNGAIDGDLYVASKNADDLFDVNGTVTGSVRLLPGGQR